MMQRLICQNGSIITLRVPGIEICLHKIHLTPNTLEGSVQSAAFQHQRFQINAVYDEVAESKLFKLYGARHLSIAIPRAYTGKSAWTTGVGCQLKL